MSAPGLWRRLLLGAALPWLALPAAIAAPAPQITAADWEAYRGRFLSAEGRVIDDANAGISHSEGQGYGLLLAYLAGDRASFDLIWRFTETELLLRDDGLVAWKWDPKAEPRITDSNNASDGDVLIAYALGLAADGWGEARYRTAGAAIATAIGRTLLREVRGRVILLPAAAGFAPPADGSVVQILNPSYWVFEAIPVLKRLAPDFDWDGLTAAGIDLVAAARFGKARLPTDWVAIEAKGLAPAPGFPPVFGYNAIRIPLYLVRGGAVGGPLLEPFRQMAAPEGVPLVNVATDTVVERLTDPGYRLVGAIVACTAGTPIPDELKVFRPTNYYPSTLQLLGLAWLAERQPPCR
ncbi:MAG TPA: glycosyl hydrolase family 8 [Bauldia sp.]|nr:glycosyl hydrolase family 8 [Bauldia sp.]